MVNRQRGSDRCAAETVSQHQRLTATEIIVWSYFTTREQHALSKGEGTFPLGCFYKYFVLLFLRLACYHDMDGHKSTAFSLHSRTFNMGENELAVGSENHQKWEVAIREISFGSILGPVSAMSTTDKISLLFA